MAAKAADAGGGDVVVASGAQAVLRTGASSDGISGRDVQAQAGGAADSLKGGSDGLRSGEGVESDDDDDDNEDDDDEGKDDDDGGGDDGDDGDDPSTSSCAFGHCRRNKSRLFLFLILIRE
jgi:hypothetical protein